jgi:hypothetical protein
MVCRFQVSGMLVLLLGVASSSAVAQPLDVPSIPKIYSVDAAVTALQTEAEKSAVGFAADLIKNPSRVFVVNCMESEIRAGRCNQGRDYGWYVDLAPDVHVLTGSQDAFQSIVGKISGRFMFARLASPQELGLGSDFPEGKILNYDRLLHVFPLSAGIETTRTGDTTNAVGEFGYVPYLLTPINTWSQVQTNKIVLGVNPRIGIFVQGGQKLRQRAALDTGGARDDSGETEGKGIARLKSLASMELFFPTRFAGERTGIRVAPAAIGWYDLINDEVYYTLKLSIGFEWLGEGNKRNTLWEFTVQDGSGEPNFTEGTQFGTGLKFVY